MFLETKLAMLKTIFLKIINEITTLSIFKKKKTVKSTNNISENGYIYMNVWLLLTAYHFQRCEHGFESFLFSCRSTKNYGEHKITN